MEIAVSVLFGVAGAVLVLATVVSAAQTLAVPRSTPVMITRWVFVAWSTLFGLVRRSPDFDRRDRVLALYAPITLLSLPFAWLGLVGLGLLALLVSYLPSIYGSYSRREVMVTSLEAQAGSPPSAVDLITRLVRIEGLDDLDEFWRDWARWFAEIEETHTTSPSLVFFRSPQPARSWVTAAGAVLDAAALVSSTLAGSRRPAAELCLRTGYLTLRRVGDYFVMPYDREPAADDPIAVRRTEFDAAYDALARVGAPLRPDRDQAWRDFAGWRVNYDQVLLRFASLCDVPTAPWSGDRPITFHRAPVARRRARSRF